MSQSEKAAYFQALKTAGVEFDKHYREYSTDELKVAYAALAAALEEQGQPAPELKMPEPAPPKEPAPMQAQYATPPQPPFTAPSAAEQPPAGDWATAAAPAPEPPRAAQADPNEMAGQRLNTHAVDEVLRVDDQGRAWLQEEVLKPAVPRPRGRRVLTYVNTGVEQRTVQQGEFSETFEVAGTGPGSTEQIKITLPSYQVGIYRDRRFPFKVITYAGNEGFDLFEVRDYYGGAELVPSEIKMVYVSNSLCYDIRTTIRAIEAEYRRLQLSGKVD